MPEQERCSKCGEPDDSTCDFCEQPLCEGCGVVVNGLVFCNESCWLRNAALMLEMHGGTLEQYGLKAI